MVIGFSRGKEVNVYKFLYWSIYFIVEWEKLSSLSLWDLFKFGRFINLL